jgi:uncharacterized protein
VCNRIGAGSVLLGDGPQRVAVHRRSAEERSLPVKRVLSVAVLLGLGVVMLSACAGSPSAAGPAPGAGGITARGQGTVTGTPDTLTIILGVQTQADRAADALDQNNQQAAAVIDTLKRSGVPETDLQTSQLTINPNTDPMTGRITGYQVTNQVTVTLHDIPKAGSVIDAASRAAGDAVRVQQVNFSISDDSALLARARANAVRQAQAQAKQMADAAGVGLGPLRSISESGGATPPPTPMFRALDNAAGSVPLQPGTQQLSVSVDVVYDINQ